MSMPGGWPEEEEEEEKVTLSVGAESKACEDDEDWPSRIDLRDSYPHNLPLDFATKNTPTGRPLAEPPMINYDDFERRFVPSRKRFQILFPERRDVGKMTDYMDLHIELEVLRTYRDWVCGILWCGDNETVLPTDGQKAFYLDLRKDLEMEESYVHDDRLCNDVLHSCSLGWWKFQHLDNDLRTTHIERELSKQRDEIFEYRVSEFGILVAEPNPEMRSKYQHLFPAGADDNFRHWYQRTKRALEKEVGESSQKMAYFMRAATNGFEYHVLRQVLLHDMPRAFGHGRVGYSRWELIRVYKNGRVLYPEYDSERGKDWMQYTPPK